MSEPHKYHKTPKKVIDYINNLPLEVEWQRLFNKPLPVNKFQCPCPSHVHVHNTPSAKVYGNRIKCFGSCNRSWGVFNLLTWYDPKRIEALSRSVVMSESVTRLHSSKLTPIKVDRSSSISTIINTIASCELIN